MNETQLSWVVCERCGQPHRWRPLSPRAMAHCVRCHAVVGRGHRVGVQTMLALTLAALITFLIAHGTELITIRLAGSELSTTFPHAVATVWRQGQPGVAALGAATAMVAPALFIGLRLYILVPLALGHVPVGMATCLRLLFHASRWNTVEVLTVGALLSLVRIADLAQAATPGPGLAALGVLALLLAALESAGLRHLWWHVP